MSFQSPEPPQFGPEPQVGPEPQFAKDPQFGRDPRLGQPSPSSLPLPTPPPSPLSPPPAPNAAWQQPQPASTASVPPRSGVPRWVIGVIIGVVALFVVGGLSAGFLFWQLSKPQDPTAYTATQQAALREAISAVKAKGGGTVSRIYINAEEGYTNVDLDGKPYYVDGRTLVSERRDVDTGKIDPTKVSDQDIAHLNQRMVEELYGDYEITGELDIWDEDGETVLVAYSYDSLTEEESAGDKCTYMERLGYLRAGGDKVFFGDASRSEPMSCWEP